NGGPRTDRSVARVPNVVPNPVQLPVPTPAGHRILTALREAPRPGACRRLPAHVRPVTTRRTRDHGTRADPVGTKIGLHPSETQPSERRWGCDEPTDPA